MIIIVSQSSHQAETQMDDENASRSHIYENIYKHQIYSPRTGTSNGAKSMRPVADFLWRHKHRIGAAVALLGFYYWLSRDDEGDEEKEWYRVESVPRPPRQPVARPSPPPRERQQFIVTDEKGRERGALGDERAHKWGWLVDTAPLAPASSTGNVAPVLRRRRWSSRDDADLVQKKASFYDADTSEGGIGMPSGSGAESTDGGDAAKDTESCGSSQQSRRSSKEASRKSVRFRLDEAAGFYGFVFGYDGRCVAHGADRRFVGRTLSEVLELTSNDEVRMRCGCACGTAPVCSSGCLRWFDPRRASTALARLHGCMHSFLSASIGLADQVDGNELHARFKSTAESGGGWVSYAWRNSQAVAVQLKGAYIIKVGRGTTRLPVHLVHATLHLSARPPKRPSAHVPNAPWHRRWSSGGTRTMLAWGTRSRHRRRRTRRVCTGLCARRMVCFLPTAPRAPSLASPYRRYASGMHTWHVHMACTDSLAPCTWHVHMACADGIYSPLGVLSELFKHLGHTWPHLTLYDLTRSLLSPFHAA